jgi:hypothetical protein
MVAFVCLVSVHSQAHQGTMKNKRGIIFLTAVGTTLFWLVVVTLFFWQSSKSPSAKVEFDRPGKMDVTEGAYRVEVLASNAASASLLFSYTSRPPERVLFSVERVQMRTAQR